MSMSMNEHFYNRTEPQWLSDSYGRSFHSREGFPHSSSRYLPEILLRVPMCCNKCEEKVREELLDMEGVYGFTCDQRHQRVSVIGSVDPFQVLKKMKRIKRKSEFWNENIYIDGKRGSISDDYYTHQQEPVYHSSHNQRQLFHAPSRITSHVTPYRNSYVDSPRRYSLSRPESPPFRLPYSHSFNYESVPAYAQIYYTEEYPSCRY